MIYQAFKSAKFELSRGPLPHSPSNPDFNLLTYLHAAEMDQGWANLNYRLQLQLVKQILGDSR